MRSINDQIPAIKETPLVKQEIDPGVFTAIFEMFK